jgi:hypothetical protein
LLTTRLVAVGDLLGIRVLDHVILGDGRYVSFADREWLTPDPAGLASAGDAAGPAHARRPARKPSGARPGSRRPGQRKAS